MKFIQSIQTDEDGLYQPEVKLGTIFRKISTPYAAGLEERKKLMQAARCGNKWAAKELKERFKLKSWWAEGKEVI